ncbi:arsenic resistance protein [Rhizobium leguminosarum]|uniref:arsenic resistance protein n=1 Tax=Rhizobium leguminosarum TaxID=384 RepID=UPI000D33B4FA|nr:arsenic resistance protein [Rhizobium leguminosarum]MBB5256019.1 ACR3 family arsenite efflux pump ArsB [Rhizobium leguminosarum]MDX6001334.1 arsenic resistance protein [Rhizobium leguminosarum]PUB63248.1 arsenic resistance protein [Rhizobium leguminosarum bv. viciae USDA 2370]
MSITRERLEENQVAIYFVAVVVAALAAYFVPGTTWLESAINPALAFMLFVTFLQVPVAELGKAFSRFKFLGVLLLTNFVVIPCIVGFLVQFLPGDPMLRLGVLLVLLTPCVDYVVTFSHLGRADARLLLAATPILLIVQMIALPVYLSALLGENAASLIQAGPFLHAFVWLIAIPLALAIAAHFWAKTSHIGEKTSAALGLLPVPATAFVLFVVVASVLPQLGSAIGAAMTVLPVYVAFAVLAPIAGWLVGRMLGLVPTEGRAIAFSASTRNSLVVLPLALAVPGAALVLPAVIVTQILVELLSELVYVRVMPLLGRSLEASKAAQT